MNLLYSPRRLALLLLAFTSFSFSSISAALEDYLKPVLGKTKESQMNGVDFIYMINLDQRPEKFARAVNQLAPYGIFPYRFSAVNGWELSLADLNDLGVKFSPQMQGGFMGTSYLTEDFQPYHSLIQNYGQTYFCHCMSRGAVGIVLSHLSVLKDALDSGYQIIWVMEDDVEVIRDPRTLSDLIHSLDLAVGRKNWDILFTDRDTRDANGNYVPCTSAARRPDFSCNNPSRYAVNFLVKPSFRMIGARFGAYSMIVNRTGMKKIWNFFRNRGLFLPYDMEFYLPNGIKLYTVLEDVVASQTRAESDNGAPNYQKK